MSKYLRLSSFVLIGVAMLSWSAATVSAAGPAIHGFSGGGHPGGFSGGHSFGGFSGGHSFSGGHPMAGFSGSPSFGGFSGGHSFSGGHPVAGFSGSQSSGGFSGGHAMNGAFVSHAPTTLHFTAPRQSFGSGSAVHPGTGRALSNVPDHLAGAHTWDWRHGQSWWHPEHFRDHDFDHFRNFPLVIAPFWFPSWYGLYGWPDYGNYGPYYPDYGYYNYGPEPSYGYDVAAYNPPATAAYSPSVTYVTPAETTSPETAALTGEDYAAQALAAFRGGDYRGALRLANHAAVEMPRDARIHELMSLSLFALGDYRGAAIEAHAALTLGPIIDWPTLHAYYGNVDAYTNQLQALESFVQSNSKAPEGHFLLAYHYLMADHKEEAKKELTETIALVPADTLAEQLLKQL